VQFLQRKRRQKWDVKSSGVVDKVGGKRQAIGPGLRRLRGRRNSVNGGAKRRAVKEGETGPIEEGMFDARVRILRAPEGGGAGEVRERGKEKAGIPIRGEAIEGRYESL